MLVEGLTILLMNDPGIKALLAPSGARSDKTTGIFPGIAPKEVNLPYITYQQVAGAQIRTMDGSPGLQNAGMQFWCYGGSYKTAKLLARAVKSLLAGLAIDLSDAESIRVEGAWLQVEMDSIEEVPHALLYGVMLSYDILFVDPATATAGLG